MNEIGVLSEGKGEGIQRMPVRLARPSREAAPRDPTGRLSVPVTLTARISDDVWPQPPLHAEYSSGRVGSVKCRFAVMHVEAASSWHATARDVRRLPRGPRLPRLLKAPATPDTLVLGQSPSDGNFSDGVCIPHPRTLWGAAKAPSMSCVRRTQPAGHQMGERDKRHPDSFSPSSRQPVETSRRPPAPQLWIRPLQLHQGLPFPERPRVQPSLFVPLPLGFRTLLRPLPSDATATCRTPVILALLPCPCSPLPGQTPGKSFECLTSPRPLAAALAERPHCALRLTASSRSSPPSTSQSSCQPDTLVLLCLPPLCPWSFLCPFCYPLAAPAASRILPLGDSTCSQAAAISSVLVPLTSPPLPTPTCAAASGHLHGDVLPTPQP
ncbi:uncharacterized protein LOC120617710 [Pteropus medius]|uniref:uncharacterized protein LOC120617710 n=1 Tax=Pteropus vampyrus TaxID=132908 RepID=UPI00196B8C26|nr:uncharacterized protein LOC120617710 [Pteropus giganteus]